MLIGAANDCGANIKDPGQDCLNEILGIFDIDLGALRWYKSSSRTNRQLTMLPETNFKVFTKNNFHSPYKILNFFHNNY